MDDNWTDAQIEAELLALVDEGLLDLAMTEDGEVCWVTKGPID